MTWSFIVQFLRRGDVTQQKSPEKAAGAVAPAPVCSEHPADAEAAGGGALQRGQQAGAHPVRPLQRQPRPVPHHRGVQVVTRAANKPSRSFTITVSDCLSVRVDDLMNHMYHL